MQCSSPRARRLQHVAGVDGALGLAGADHGVQLVDEDDGAALVLRQLLQHALQPLLEFAAVLGAGEQRGHVEHQQPLALQAFRHFLVDDALRQALDDGGLADARLADQHRVVLGAPLQDLDAAADFIVAADHRVELAGAGAVGEIKGEFAQRLSLAFVRLRRNIFAAPDLFDGLLQVLLRDAGVLEQVRRREQEHFGRDVLVAALCASLSATLSICVNSRDRRSSTRSGGGIAA